MSEAADFIDAALQREASWERAEALNSLEDGFFYYGASVGAIRGAVRDARRKFRDLTHDEVAFLSSELWGNSPVFERRLAAVVLLQSSVLMLRNTDLTRIEGFLRESRTESLAAPLAADVVRPLVARLTGQERMKALAVVGRWAQDQEPMLRRAAGVVRQSLPA